MSGLNKIFYKRKRKSMANPILDNLNPQQKEAVMHTQGPLLVFAGAGSGKTRVITRRIAYLISEKGVSSENILAVTFTKKAAEEMKERVEEILRKLEGGVEQTLPTIGTFHSIASGILRREAQKADLASNFTILDAKDSENMIKEIMLELDIDVKQFKPRSISWYIQQAKNDLVSAENFPLTYSGFVEDIAAQVYENYEMRKTEINAVDFGDLLFKTVQLFKDNEDIINKYQKRYEYLLVDEYQDTNKVQYDLSRMLAADNNNICVVGDDDQGIYKWRGADIKNIINFQKDFNNVKVVKLEQNYRSVANVIEAAVSVIKKNNERVDKALWTEKNPGEPIVVYQSEDAESEANFVVDEILDMKARGRTLSEMSVLYRTNYQSRAIEEAMLKRGVPYKLIGGYRFYDRKEVKDILSYLKFIINPKDTVSVLRVINSPSRKMGPKSVGALSQIAKKCGCELGELLIAAFWIKKSDLPVAGFSEELVPNIAELGDELSRFQKVIDIFGGMFYDSNGQDVADVIDMIISRTRYIESFDDGSDEAQARKENLMELKNVASGYKNSNDNDESEGDLGNPAIVRFLEGVALLEDTDSLESNESGKVTLMTLHSSKGLEFPVVFIVGMEEGLLPHSRSLSDYAEIEEERRLCYVGITRAKERLFLSFAKSRMVQGGDFGRVPSRFLADIPEDVCDFFSQT
ncbi:AAA family ATPase [Candidatus Dojkabacteria bacterium]|nr:AAA family ATPase [Candidatus Dojkabacteria bacterium]